jgi:hypothetical protein
MAKAKKKVTKKAGSTAGDDKAHKIIIIGDDGQFYALEKSQWMVDANVVQDAGTKSSVKVLKDAGAYLSYVSPKLSVGAGMACTVVNLAAILNNAKK